MSHLLYLCLFFLSCFVLIGAQTCSSPLNQIPNSYIKGGAGRFKAVGATSSVIIDPTSNGQIIHLATVAGGIWKSTDGGMTWSWKTSQLPCQYIGSLTFDMSDTSYKTIWATVASLSSAYYLNGESEVGLYVSRDGGETYSVVASGQFRNVTLTDLEVRGNKILVCSMLFAKKFISSGNINNSVINPDETDRLAPVDSRYGVFASYDAGKTWTGLMTGFSCNNIEADVDSPNKVWIALNKEYIYSVNMDDSTMKMTQFPLQIPSGCLSSGFVRTKLTLGKGVVYVSTLSFVSKKDQLPTPSIKIKWTEKLSCLLYSATTVVSNSQKGSSWIALDTFFSDGKRFKAYEPIVIGQSETHFGFAGIRSTNNFVFLGNTYQTLVRDGGISGETIAWSGRVTMCDASKKKGQQCIPATDWFASNTNGHPDSRNLVHANVGGVDQIYDCNDGGLYVLNNAISSSRKWIELINYPTSELNGAAYDPVNDYWVFTAQDNGIAYTEKGITTSSMLARTGDGTLCAAASYQDSYRILSGTQMFGSPTLFQWNGTNVAFTPFSIQLPKSVQFTPFAIYREEPTFELLLASYGNIYSYSSFSSAPIGLFSGVTGDTRVKKFNVIPFSTSSGNSFVATTFSGFILARTGNGQLINQNMFQVLRQLEPIGQLQSACGHPHMNDRVYIVTRRNVLESSFSNLDNFKVISNFVDSGLFKFKDFQEIQDCIVIPSKNSDAHYLIVSTNAVIYATRITETTGSSPSYSNWFQLSNSNVFYQSMRWNPSVDMLTVTTYGSSVYEIKQTSSTLDCAFAAAFTTSTPTTSNVVTATPMTTTAATFGFSNVPSIGGFIKRV